MTIVNARLVHFVGLYNLQLSARNLRWFKRTDMMQSEIELFTVS